MFNKDEWLTKLMCMDTDPSGGGDGNEDPTPDPQPEDKSFTQDQVNSMVAAEKRKTLSSVYKGLGFESEDQAKEFIQKYKQEEEQNKTDLVKAQEAAKKAEEEKAAETARAQDLQYKFDAISEGCDASSASDVVVLAKAKMTDDKDFATALKEVKEQYPAMFGQTDNGSGGTGGGGTSPRKRTGGKELSGIGKRLAEQKRKTNTIKDNEYFK